MDFDCIVFIETANIIAKIGYIITRNFFVIASLLHIIANLFYNFIQINNFMV